MALTKHSVDQRQNTDFELVMLKVNNTATTSSFSNAGLDEGKYQATVKRTGSGVYVIRLNQAAARDLFVVGYAVALADTTVTFSVVGKQEITMTISVGGTPTSASFWLTLGVFNSKTAR